MKGSVSMLHLIVRVWFFQSWLRMEHHKSGLYQCSVMKHVFVLSLEFTLTTTLTGVTSPAFHHWAIRMSHYPNTVSIWCTFALCSPGVVVTNIHRSGGQTLEQYEAVRLYYHHTVHILLRIIADASWVLFVGNPSSRELGPLLGPQPVSSGVN